MPPDSKRQSPYSPPARPGPFDVALIFNAEMARMVGEFLAKEGFDIEARAILHAADIADANYARHHSVYGKETH